MQVLFGIRPEYETVRLSKFISRRLYIVIGRSEYRV